MGQVIHVDFQKKQVKQDIPKYTITKVSCVVCNHLVINDSRKDDVTPYVPLSTQKATCICKNCLVELATLVKQEGWTNEE